MSNAITPPSGSQEAREIQNGNEDVTMRDTTPCQESIHDKKDGTPPRALQNGDHDKKYDTPPRDIQEAVSPISSRKKGTTRAASLGISPIAGRGDIPKTTAMQPTQISNTSSSARVAKHHLRIAPRSILTSKASQRMLRPIMEPPITPIGTFGGSPRLIASRLNSHHNLGNVPGSFDEAVRSPLILGNQRVREPVVHHLVRDAFDLDPYGHRADEIGLNHGILSLGHLGDILAPPGWQRGQPPFNQAAIETLYSDARKMARSNLQKPDPHDVAKSKQQDLEWNAQLELDQLLLKERIAVYDRYCKRNMGQQDRSQLPPPGGKLVTPTNSQFSANAYSLGVNQNHPMGSQLNPACALQNDTAASHPQYNMSNTLHPALRSASMTSTLDRFHQDNAEIMRRKSAIETNLSSCLSQLHTNPNQQGSQSLISPVGNPGSRQSSFSSDMPWQTAPQGSYGIGPIPYRSPRQAAFPNAGPSTSQSNSFYTPAPPAPTLQSQPTNYLHPIPRPNPACHGSNSQPLGVQTPYSRGQTPSENIHKVGRNEIDVKRRGITPTRGRPKKGTARKISPKKSPARKGRPWFEDHIDRSNMPRTEISEESMAKGLAYVPHHIRNKRASTEEASVQSETLPKPKRRRGKDLPDPAVGMPISEDVARHLLAAGARNGLGGYQFPPAESNTRSPPKAKTSRSAEVQQMYLRAKAALDISTREMEAEWAAGYKEDARREEARRQADSAPMNPATGLAVGMENTQIASSSVPRGREISNGQKRSNGTSLLYPVNQRVASAGHSTRVTPKGGSSNHNNDESGRTSTPVQSGHLVRQYTTAPNPANLGIIQFTPVPTQANNGSLQASNRQLPVQNDRLTIDLTTSPERIQAVPVQGTSSLATSQTDKVEDEEHEDSEDEEEGEESEELSSLETSSSDPDDEDFRLPSATKSAKRAGTRQTSRCASATQATSASGHKRVPTNERLLRSNNMSVDIAASSTPQQLRDQDKTQNNNTDDMEE